MNMAAMLKIKNENEWWLNAYCTICAWWFGIFGYLAYIFLWGLDLWPHILLIITQTIYQFGIIMRSKYEEESEKYIDHNKSTDAFYSVIGFVALLFSGVTTCGMIELSTWLMLLIGTLTFFAMILIIVNAFSYGDGQFYADEYPF